VPFPPAFSQHNIAEHLRQKGAEKEFYLEDGGQERHQVLIDVLQALLEILQTGDVDFTVDATSSTSWRSMNPFVRFSRRPSQAGLWSSWAAGFT
jgi:hypothetical protein